MNQSALRAIEILEYLSERGQAGLTAIAGDLGLNKSTAHRFLSALVRSGYVRRTDSRGSYALTMRILHLANRVLEQVDIRNDIHPILEECARDSSETAHLAVLEDNEIVYIDKVEGRRAVHMASRIGSRGTCHSTALGKVLLAHRPEEAWVAYVQEKGLTRRTRNTILDAQKFYAELKRVRARGWAMDDIENEEGIRCIAAPARDHSGQVRCAISISGWTVTMTRKRAQLLVPVVVAHARSASDSLGYSGDHTIGDGRRTRVSSRAAGETRATPRKSIRSS